MLDVVQGECIPKLIRPAPVMLYEGLNDGIVLSLVTGPTLEAIGVDAIAELPRSCCERGVHDLHKMHLLGVLHGDLVERTLILHEIESCRPRLVFVDFGRAEINCSANDVRFNEEVNVLCVMLYLVGKDDAIQDE
ncbi:Aste57867_10325 [Aphanomyces stellatus]|uniref:Aste57867_10325 protein n=1 Tax=Aphanomyces stellatus TaxID=120398 RepID=A0A485KQ22_9STRA|nr:hypothetical protein As57867_010285 [Aphanomyces stellatus]VFT87199.1 Aste57867_10325 [Aphanomyces stellatus]